ncbi:MAG: preprotein translocase subunit SecY [Oscillospiraceae bacterium]|nr:preprotein translocase subunit SecY [Oscillospiraceae bacterium]MBP1552865.1 preprotein translocase subunit SecY [Oscillospiraceae bacterium]MBQ5313734.1 preprotein translocase subunit SecY [Oscillospiraceae bacterium]
MLQTFKNAWQVEELRKKLIFTAIILVIFRLGCAIAVPFVDPDALQGMLSAGDGNMLGYLNMLTGGAFASATVFALGVTPYINSSIIITLLTVAIPYLENLSKQGEEGRKKLNKITRYAATGFAAVLSIAYYFLLRRQNALMYTEGLSGFFAAVVIIATFIAGTTLLMWLGEQIDKHGIGNGISLLIFAGIISGASSMVTIFVNMLKDAVQNQKTQNFFLVPLFIAFGIAVIAFAVVLSKGERRIPVQYAKRVVGNKMMGGQNTHLPIKVNMSGVMPIIFASALVSIPGTIASFVNVTSPFWQGFLSIFNYNSLLYAVIYLLLIIMFNYFYVSIQYNPVEIANNLRKNNGVIPGFRPGKNTQDFIARVLSKITFIGALFLGVVAILPIIVGNLTSTGIQMGGTSLLIVVGVALDTAQQLESQMVMRHHKGFLK